MKKGLFVVLLAGCAVAAFGQNGVIKDLIGTVEIKSAGAAAFVPARAGDEIALDTIVSTGFKSSATITVGSATILVKPITRLSLSEISSQTGAESINMNLNTGRVRIDVKPPSGTKEDFKVTTPVVTASVRGTSFDLDTRSLSVREGTVVFRGTNGATIPVQAGGSSHVVVTTGMVADPIEVRRAETLTPVLAGAQDMVKPLPPVYPETTINMKLGW